MKDREILIEILARLRRQDSLRCSEIANEGSPDSENFRVRYESELKRHDQIINLMKREIQNE